MENVIKKENNKKFSQASRLSFRGVCVCIFVVLLIASALAVRMPVMDMRTRVLLLVTLFFGIFTVFTFTLKYIGNHPAAFYPIVIFLVMVSVWYVLDNKPFDTDMLRVSYRTRLNDFVGVKYVMGGESSVGIDCSGLARTALWQSMIRQGLKEVNPKLLGPMLWNFWWRDLSVQDILNGKYGYTEKIGQASKLAGYNNKKLKIGDMAVVGSTSQVLIYMGEDKWIEANPDDKKVVINKADAHSKRPYFNMNTILIRWRVFDAKDSKNSESNKLKKL